MSTFCKELAPSKVVQKEENTAVLKAIFHAEKFGARGLPYDLLMIKTRLDCDDVLKAAIQELVAHGLVEAFVPNKETFYRLTEKGESVARRLK